MDFEQDGRPEIPLHQQKPFGTGLYRKTIAFVPATSDILQTSAAPSGKSVADLYLSMVLPTRSQSEPASLRESQLVDVCEICKLPLDGNRELPANNRHEASLVHQVCLVHSHPPSALDRERMGLVVLESQGWDPDARQGLGATGQGIQFPVKAVPKDNTLGVGLVVPTDFEMMKKKEKPQLLDAKKVRKMAQDDKKKSEKIRQQLFSSVDMDRYLGLG
jgi:hypothetical protein